MILDFGQPSSGIVQFAYTVPNVREAAQRWTDLTGIGPWFIRGPFTTTKSRYRGELAPARLVVAQAFSGHSMIELIEQQDNAPSVYRERIDVDGFGFHHVARSTLDFDADFAKYVAGGFSVAYESILPTNARLAYFDTTEELGGMVELVELTTAQEDVYTNVFRAAQGWDGTEPFRTH